MRETADHAGADLLSGAVVNILATLAGGIRVLFVVLVARLLGEAVLATYLLAWAITDILGKFGTLGLGVAVTPEVARFREKSRTLLLTTVPLGVGASLAMALLASGVIALFGKSLFSSPELSLAVAVMVFALPGVAAYRISNGFSRGLRIMRHDIYSRGLAESLVTMAVFLAVYAAGVREMAPVAAVLAGTAAGGILAFLLALRACHEREGGFSSGEARRMTKYALPVAGYGMLNLLILRLDVLMLGVFVNRAPGLDLASFGAYCAAVEIANLMRRVRQVFEPIYLPLVAGRMTGTELEPARDVVAQMSRWSLALLLPLAGTLLLTGSLFLAVLGPGFGQAAPWLAVLVVSRVFFSFFGLAEALMLVHRPSLNLINSSAAAALQFILCLLLIPRFGAGGAAAAILVSSILLGLLRIIELVGIFRWHWPWRALNRPLVAFGASGIAGMAVRGSLAGTAGAIAAATVFLGVNLLCWKIMGLDDDDRATLRELRRRWRSRRASGRSLEEPAS